MPDEGKEAITHVDVVERLAGYTLLACRLETGRTHQIRIHLAELGHPVSGDKVYHHKRDGTLLPDPSGAPRLALHAVEITEMKENIFYADLLIGDGLRVSARPSDSIALALRVGAPIRCNDQVLTEAGIIIPDEQEDEVEKFREFLEQVRPEDFAG